MMSEIATIKPKDIVGYGDVAVVTTRQLAEFYDTTPERIRQNFNRNQEWFIEGESYFRIQGNDLKTFRESVSKSDAFSAGRGHIFTLWTEEGALLHSKMINTREAWQIHKMLVLNYFDPYAKKAYREAAKKARQASAEWQKNRQIGIDDGRVPLTKIIEGYYLMYLRQKETDHQPAETFYKGFTKQAYFYTFSNYRWKGVGDDFRDSLTQEELKHLMETEKQMQLVVVREVGKNTYYKDAHKCFKVEMEKFAETHGRLMCQALPQMLT